MNPEQFLFALTKALFGDLVSFEQSYYFVGYVVNIPSEGVRTSFTDNEFYARQFGTFFADLAKRFKINAIPLPSEKIRIIADLLWMLQPTEETFDKLFHEVVNLVSEMCAACEKAHDDIKREIESDKAVLLAAVEEAQGNEEAPQ